jgi:hypothetical protein
MGNCSHVARKTLVGTQTCVTKYEVYCAARREKACCRLQMVPCTHICRDEKSIIRFMVQSEHRAATILGLQWKLVRSGQCLQ